MDAETTHTLEIVELRDELAGDFERLNREWLEGHGLLEDGDLPYLRDPRGTIVARGGCVLVALDGGAVIGTVAVIPLDDGIWELAKLAVAGAARRRGVGRRLTHAAIERARSAGARKLVLSSSRRLAAAVRLYESLGFRHVPSHPGGVVYASADVFMELPLVTPGGH